MFSILIKYEIVNIRAYIRPSDIKVLLRSVNKLTIEIIALCDAVEELVYIKNLTEELGLLYLTSNDSFLSIL